MSLDGFITGPNDRIEAPLGENGDLLHEWIYELASWRESHDVEGGIENADSALMAESISNIGATVMGKRMFVLGEEPWGDNPPFHTPVFVVTHHARAPIAKEGGTSYIFVTDGLPAAMDQARAAAGDKDVSVAGGANIIQQCLKADILDDLQIHIVPLLLGEGRNI